VKAALDAVEARIEARPDQYHRLEYQSLLKESREQVARLIGAKADECVLVTNTSVGLNTILRNFAWNEGDILVGGEQTTAYFGVISPLICVR
jgi:hercynylcysteine S-oxide lyase